MANLLFNLHFQAHRVETSKACLTEKISSQKGMQWFNTFHSPKGAQLHKWAKSDSNTLSYKVVYHKTKKTPQKQNLIKKKSIFLLSSLPAPSIQKAMPNTKAWES